MNLIKSLKEADEYFSDLLVDEKTNLENMLGQTGELRKQIEKPFDYLKTENFENILEFLLQCNKYRDTPILI